MNFRRAKSIINMMLSTWGFSKLVVGKEIRKKVDGKRVRISCYILKQIKVKIDHEIQEYDPHFFQALKVRKNIIRTEKPKRMLSPNQDSLNSVEPSERYPEVTPEVLQLFISFYLHNKNWIGEQLVLGQNSRIIS